MISPTYITHLIIQKGDDRDEIETMVRSTVEQESAVSYEMFVSLQFLVFLFYLKFYLSIPIVGFSLT